MAHDDRDRSFEQALARNLRAAAAESAAPSKMCADAETLAAYHASSLSPEHMTSLKQHIAACPRCEEILTQLEATEEIPLEVPGAERVGAGVSEGGVFRPARMRYWQWLVPAGAVAAGLLVWISLRQPMPLRVETAKNEAPSIMAQQNSPLAQPLVPSAPAEDKTKESSAIGGVAGNPSPTRRAGVPESLARDAKKLKSPLPMGSGSSTAPDVSVNGRAAKSLESSAEPAFTASNAISAGERQDLAKQAEVDAFAPAPAPVPAPTPPVVSQPPAAESVRVTTEATAPPKRRAKVAAASATPTAQLPDGDTGRMLVAGAAVQLANARTPTIISPPSGSSSMWRVGAAGRIEHSADSGATWDLQSSGVIADLVAGSASSEKICWVVGRNGTIVRTTDAGATWSSLQSPISDDLRAIFAVNAQEATIFSDHQAYQTTDGGLTWTKLAPKN
jgi:hypothetical protein